MGNPWRPPATVFIRPCFLLGHSSSASLSMIRAQEAPDVNSPTRALGLGRLGSRFHRRCTKHAGTPAPLWSHSMITGRKGGASLAARLFAALYRSSFWEASRRKFTGPCPRRCARDSSSAPFLAFVLTLQLTGCFLKILVCVCFFRCQVP